MKQMVASLLLSLFCFEKMQAEPVSNTAVTYTFSGGRLGDNLLSYMHAKWVSYNHGALMLYKPFPYSDLLVLHEKEQLFTATTAQRYPKTVFLGRGAFPTAYQPSPVLYVLPYFPESTWELANSFDHESKKWPYYPVDWEDSDFKEELKKMICLRNPCPKMNLPKDRITVAVHLRKGGGFDNENDLYKIPQKFPNEQFYIDQIAKIYEIVKGYPLYVYLFTDDANPQVIRQRFQQKFQGNAIQFDCRETQNNHYSNVLEDFFALTQFDCFIHSESNFAICASKLGDYMIDIFPVDYQIENRQSRVTKVRIKTRPELFPEHLKAYLGN